MDEQTLIADDKGKTFKDLIKNKLASWRHLYDDDNRYRVAELVTMVRRDRSDHFGNFDESWLDRRHPLQMTWKPQMSKGMVTYPVIRRAVNAKIATELSTDVRLTIEPVRKDPRTEAVSSMSNKIWAYGRRTVWDEQFDYNQAKMRQLGRCVYIHVSKDLEGGVDIPYPNMVPKPSVSGLFTLDCATCGREVMPEEVGASNPIQIAQENLDAAFERHSAAKQEMGELGSSEEPDYQGAYDEALAPENLIDDTMSEPYLCPICAEGGITAPLTPNLQDMKMTMVPAHDGTFNYKKSGQINGQLISPLLTRIDEFNALGFEMHKAHWFNYRFLMPTYEVELMCGEDNSDAHEAVKNHTHEHWSDAVRWHYELRKNRGNVSPEYTGTNLTHLTECELWWIRPIACKGWKATGNEEIGDWSIKTGQTIEESFTSKSRKGEKPVEFKGLALLVVGDEIIKVFNEDFRKNWLGVAWTPDPHSYFPQGEERLLPLQDAATRVFTLIYSFSQRSSAPRTVANQLHFTREDLEAHVVGGIILSKLNTKNPDELDLRKHIFNLDAGDLPSSMSEFVQMLISIIKEETGVYDEQTGAGSSYNRTKGGRELALDRSLGLQLPQMQSKGRGLREFAYRYLEHAQEMDDAFFTLFIDENEEEWTDVDIEQFRKTDIRKEINISVTEGSDVPRTREELEEAYLAAIAEGLFDPNNPTPVDIRAIILKIRGINYDLQDQDANLRVANTRYENIRKKLMAVNPGDAIVMMPTPDPADPTGATPLMVQGEPVMQPQLDPRLLQALMTEPDTQPQEFADNHFIFIDFFKKKLYGVIGAKSINPVLVLGINAYIAAHRGYVAADLAKQMALSGGAAGGPDGEQSPDSSDKGKKKDPK